MAKKINRLTLPCFFMAAGLTNSATAYTGQDCVAEDNEARAICIAMIGAVRTSTAGADMGDPACATHNPDDLAVSYAVIDWIKAHPERRSENLTQLIREALVTIDSCAQ